MFPFSYQHFTNITIIYMWHGKVLKTEEPLIYITMNFWLTNNQSHKELSYLKFEII